MAELDLKFYRDTDLAHHLITMERSDETFVDATWTLPGSLAPLPDHHLGGAKIFDLGHLKSVTPLGAAFPPPDHVVKMADALGIQKTDTLILFDKHGLFSAPRVWWTFKSVGHENVKIINGGLPAIIDGGYAPSIRNTPSVPVATQGYKASASLVKGVVMKDVLSAIDSEIQIVDARGAGRFYGTLPEPREGLRSGHIPGSINLPMGALLDEKKWITPQTESIIAKAGIDLSKPIITTCGSGVTAAGLAFIFDVFGAKNVSVYSGSWAEWGASDAPIEV